MRIIFIDTETTGLPDKDYSSVIELGSCTWVSDVGIISMESFLLNNLRVKEMPEDSYRVHGIKAETVLNYGRQPASSLGQFFINMKEADAICAARYVFDKEMLERDAKRLKITMPQCTWIDFLSDIPYGPKIKGHSVAHIAADHGFVNPFPHRALTDVLTMVSVIERGKYNMKKVVEDCQSPMLTVRAKVSFEQKEMAKKKGFKWNPTDKVWFKALRENQYIKERETYAFETTIEKEDR